MAPADRSNKADGVSSSQSINCPRCHHAAPNPMGCTVCAPVRLGERLKETIAQRDAFADEALAAVRKHGHTFTPGRPGQLAASIDAIAAAGNAKSLSVLKQISRSGVVATGAIGADTHICVWCGYTGDAEEFEHNEECPSAVALAAISEVAP